VSLLEAGLSFTKSTQKRTPSIYTDSETDDPLSPGKTAAWDEVPHCSSSRCSNALELLTATSAISAFTFPAWAGKYVVTILHSRFLRGTPMHWLPLVTEARPLHLWMHYSFTAFSLSLRLWACLWTRCAFSESTAHEDWCDRAVQRR